MWDFEKQEKYLDIKQKLKRQYYIVEWEYR